MPQKKYIFQRILYYIYGEKFYKRLNYQWSDYPSRFELIQHIKNYLQDGKYSSDTNNTEFLYEYGSGYTAIQANTNALNAFNEILE